jgi:predicted HTH transcriptional regulator
MDLKKIISQDESETVEFKKSPSESKEIIKTISAFANTKSGRPSYKRVGKSTLLMSKDEYGRGVLHTPFQERSILEKHKDKLYFDSQICKEATLADIDKEKIRWFLNPSIPHNPLIFRQFYRVGFVEPEPQVEN